MEPRGPRRGQHHELDRKLDRESVATVAVEGPGSEGCEGNEGQTLPTIRTRGGGGGSLFDRGVELLDNNLRLFRTIPWVLGGIGIVLLYKNTHWFRQFRKVAEIPKHLFATNTRLYGCATSCEWDSVYVWHITPVMQVFGWKNIPPADHSPDKLLRIKFAGVAITRPMESKKWLEQELAQRPVWFTPLTVNRDQQALECVVLSKRKGVLQRRYSVNKALLADGLGVMTDTVGFRDQKQHTLFVTGLGRSERQAQSRGRGIWEGSEHVVWWRRITRALRNIFRRR